MTSTNRLIIGMVGAAAAGVIIGMLLAPESGPELRKKIADNAGNWANKFVDLLGSVKDESTKALQETADAMKAPAVG